MDSLLVEDVRYAGTCFLVSQFILKRETVLPFGLATGILPEPDSFDISLRYKIGERVVYFTVIDRSEQEIVMAEDDKHLYFRTLVLVEKSSDLEYFNVYLTPLVQFHNIWGKSYFTPVRPFHKLIMKTLLKMFSKDSNNQ